ncbi:hypothetical protein AU252_01150 [Pseudarthrobacter sulfonivorans]|uniref:Major facilitator superfamily (MFS) profile domain-containing protein n=1 Tax=Pseudarthrobacter sulfonivorans TaxID=121292 RepID=A0A0U3QJY2_9MICC|nr:MFS transporter [Pseudarthrobacter sulfonivorans]ALV39941.1 hypothetical protein AU252_01150 [Pseudarthrobacter sulfonivorans]
MILMTGLPAVVVGVIAYFYITDTPDKARWLTPAQASAISAEIEAETDPQAKKHSSMKGAFNNPKLWLLAFASMGIIYGLYGVGFFLPTMIAGFGKQFGTNFSGMETSLLISVPYAFAAVGMILWARSSARRGDFGWHIMIMMMVGAFGILLSAYSSTPWMTMIGVTLCAVGVISSMPLVWGLPMRILSGTAAAAGLALINTLANFGGFAGPMLTGWLRELSGGPQLPFTAMAIILLLSGATFVYVQRVYRAEKATDIAAAKESVEAR